MIALLLAILCAVFFPGIIVRVKSILSGRKGPGILQPWKNIYILLKKGSVYSKTTSFIFQIAPLLYFSTIICAMLLLPFPGQNQIIGFEGDFVFFAYLLGLGKLFFIISAMDTGSSFEGMGANREALYSLLVEPAFFILVGTLSLFTGYTSMSQLFTGLSNFGDYYYIFNVITVYVLMGIVMIENSRMPVDDPKTHLELTMVHEVMILDNSGFDLALIQIASILKFLLYGTLIANCIIPSQWGLFEQAALFILIQIIFASTIGWFESFRARKKMIKNPQFIVTLGAISLLAFVLAILLKYNML